MTVTLFQQAAPAPTLAMRLAPAAMLLAAVALAGCDRANGKVDKAGEDAPVAVPVEVAAPVRGDMEAVYTGTASITADHTAIVMPKVRGEVRAVLVEEGDRVRAGQVLMIPAR